MPNPFVHQLANGLTLSVVEAPASHQVSISLLVRVGSRFEDLSNNGVSHFLEHMLFRGNAGWKDSAAIFRAFEEVGSIPNAMTDVEYTEFFFVAHPDRVAQGLEALARLVRAPLFPMLDKERGVVLDEIFYDYDEQGRLIHPGALAARSLWPDHPLGLSVTGTPESLPLLDEPMLRAHHERYYVAKNMVLGIVGRIAAAEAHRAVKNSFGNWNGKGPYSGPLPAPAEGAEETGAPHITLVPHTDNQFQVQLSFPAPSYNAPEEIALGLMVRLLDDGPTSRLQLELREERGLVYHIGAGYSGFQDAGQVDISTTAQPDKLGEVLAATMDCLARFRDEGVAEQELARAKQRYWFDLEFERDSLPAALARHAWSLLYTKPRGEEEEWRQVKALTGAEIQKLAARIFRAERAHLVVVGPLNRAAEKEVEQALKRLG